MFNWLKKLFGLREVDRIAAKWQRRCDQMVADGVGDCDVVSPLLMKEMQKDGLVFGRDFVTVRCDIKLPDRMASHMCIEMFGKNCLSKYGRPNYKINGIRVGTAINKPARQVWKAEYFLVLLLVLFLSGCAVVGEHHVVDENGDLKLVQRIKLDRGGKLSTETPKGFKMELDTREANFWQKNVVPMVAGGLQRTEAVVQ